MSIKSKTVRSRIEDLNQQHRKAYDEMHVLRLSSLVYDMLSACDPNVPLDFGRVRVIRDEDMPPLCMVSLGRKRAFTALLDWGCV